MDDLTITSATGRTGQLYYMRGDVQKVLKRNIDLNDTEALQTLVADAQRNYPTQALKLNVYRKTGTRSEWEQTINLSPEPAATDMPPPAQHSYAQPAPDANFQHLVLTMQEARVTDALQRLRDSEARVAILEQEKRDLEKKNTKLENDAQFAERDKAWAIKEALAEDADENKPSGLAGVLAPVVSAIPADQLGVIVTGLAGMLLQRFGMGGTPAQGAAPQLAGNLTDGQRQVIQQLTDWASHSEARAVEMYQIFQIALSQPDGQGMNKLIQLVQENFPNLHVAA